MAGYTIAKLEEAADILGDYPGEMRFLAGPLETEQDAFTYRRMPARTGGKGSYGHRHRTQEEVYLVISGRLDFKLDDEVVEVGAGDAVRVAPEVVRSMWNEGPDDAEIVICSTRTDDLGSETETVSDFWPG